MVYIEVGALPCTEEELRAAVLAYVAAVEAHKTSVGQPAPWPQYDIVLEIVARGGDFVVVHPQPDAPPRPVCPGPEVCYDWDEANFQWVHNAAKQAEYERLESIRVDAQRLALIDRLRTATPAEIEQYVDANVNSLADAKSLFKRVLKVLALLARE
jgi:hypothetical protein